MKNNILYIVLIIILSFIIRTTSTTSILMVAGTGWCITLFLLIKNIVETIIKKQK